LKQREAVAILLDLVVEADVMLEGFRPGVAERLGFGPDVCTARNPRIVYGRMTGWGQSGPLPDRPGHDINYIALSGALDAIGNEGGPPVLPLNLVGDYGGGALYLAVGVLAALHERDRSGRGQVVDAAMVDGAVSLMSMIYEMRELGFWEGERGSNLLDGGCPFYDTYRTADGGFMAVGALEPRFFESLMRGLGIDRTGKAAQYDSSGWQGMRREIADVFITRTREEWTRVFEDTDACVTPVLPMERAPDHPHNAERETFIDVGGSIQARVVPRFSRTVPGHPTPQPGTGEHTDEILGQLGFAAGSIAGLRSRGVVY
jgi:alpha-methylacyl-CoA racemase